MDKNSTAKRFRRVNFVPHNREDLLNKIEELKLADDEDDEDFSFCDSDVDSDFDAEDSDNDDGEK